MKLTYQRNDSPDARFLQPNQQVKESLGLVVC